jgi:hypothetical protein
LLWTQLFDWIYPRATVGLWSLLGAYLTLMFHMTLNIALMVAVISRLMIMANHWRNDNVAQPTATVAVQSPLQVVLPQVVHHHSFTAEFLPPEPTKFLPFKANDPGHTVFYNIYVNPNDRKLANVAFNIKHSN